MIYVKSILAGLGALVIALIAVTLVSAAMLLSTNWLRPNGGITSVAFGAGPAFWFVVTLIFAAGFWWEFRRARAGLPFLPPLGLAALVLLVLALGAVQWYFRPTLERGSRAVTPQEQEPSS